LGWTSIGAVLPLPARLGLALGAVALGPLLTAWALGLPTPALGALGLAAALGTAGVGTWLHHSVVRPLARVTQQALGVAAGDPGEYPMLQRVDEIGQLQRAIQQAGLNLRSLVDDVSAQVGGIETASTEIAQGNHDLNSRTDQAAASLQQTATATEQMYTSVQHNAQTAARAAELAVAASAAAAHGGQMVGTVVTTMAAISQASLQIQDIIGVINNIAFQTNILALNAAVEAARAGEQGRGFAVVAGEVRTLAQRSASAANEIRTLIGNSVAQVEAGSMQVDAAGRAMAGIVAQVAQVSNLLGQISTATREQSEGIAQVSAAITQLDAVTQQNAALVEQSSAAADSLKGRASRLLEAVAVFSLAPA
jgi:aerotaxis receptor